ncbi:myelin-associated glycoprotein [Pimephales promelas]|uniref:myelin-associated glycoprotein n=1 Tax=Pimephales promelas TaxID=90988 RepID=UPI0019559F1E|nr:myelin-associated glycoprotein [Pimephales promelas]KAG1932365.1 myelin-associated glycoprotein [Pimephales promelas]
MALDAAIGLFTVMTACLWRATPALSLSAPGRVFVLEGSCLVLPCSFSPVPSATRMEVRLTRTPTSSYLIMRRPTVLFSTHRGDTIHPHFRDRTSLAGNLSSGDCSINIARIRTEDQNTYELQMRELGQRSWAVGTKINVSVTDTPEPPEVTDPGPVKHGQRVMLNCSVRLSCPSERPHLQWKWERGDQGGSSVHGDTELQRDPGHLPVMWTSLSFTVPQHTNPRVRCEVDYQKNRRSSATREILVHFPPKDVSIQVLTASVRVGGNALLSCSCKADPPAFEFQWSTVQSGNTVILPKRTSTIRIYNVTRDTRAQCTVANRLGRAASRLTGLNVQYAPVILSNSSCDWDGTVLSCFCAVDSNPRPAVTWSVNGSHLPDTYNASFSYFNHILTATLMGFAHAPLPVECYAVNSLGNDSHVLYEAHDGHPKWIVIGTACAVFFLLLLSLLIFYCCCCTNRQRHVMAYRPPAIHPESLGIYQERMPLYINCSEVTNIYTNGSYQLIYQNSTPLFVRSKQIHKRERRAARRRREPRERPTNVTIDSDTAIYVEVI